ncbi:SDR family oxidoreductase [Novosphingobium taihuense]|uniref:NAD(P)-dependent dehydrogenase (Short-subunit alcohol dehydrogenase family) n=1 Tax=Novosphingobium taihuense TaxID=260085 RepID=A0A7W7AF20_9SPHN|nr:SDR family oxidoreductase [Novosphingobium taihuense]MBB4614892.1 NAD(P)-dependent dehydrogenase (short-subunit alcohol dehydrogenase family) [Novosphingobium taihuense]TWH84667.1 NAD(P)-dependent dehydrogenase (short-subunit alcohol dehydrogenase family) [Novosphingobium taihuense]
MTTVAITGAARGIGLELARQHVEAGDRVIALVRDLEGATELAELAASSGGRLTVHAMDVADDASVRAGAAQTTDEPVDVLYNVAGVLGPTSPELESSDWAEWDNVFRIMLQGPLRVLQAFLPRLGAGSKVINFSSQLAASTWPYGGFYAYAGAKAALNRVMRSVAVDLKDRGVVVGLLHPGYVQTDLGGPDADITPAESAAGIRKVAAEWTLETSGDFLQWNGEPHAW